MTGIGVGLGVGVGRGVGASVALGSGVGSAVRDGVGSAATTGGGSLIVVERTSGEARYHASGPITASARTATIADRPGWRRTRSAQPRRQATIASMTRIATTAIAIGTRFG